MPEHKLLLYGCTVRTCSTCNPCPFVFATSKGSVIKLTCYLHWQLGVVQNFRQFQQRILGGEDRGLYKMPISTNWLLSVSTVSSSEMNFTHCSKGIEPYVRGSSQIWKAAITHSGFVLGDWQLCTKLPLPTVTTSSTCLCLLWGEEG